MERQQQGDGTNGQESLRKAVARRLSTIGRRPKTMCWFSGLVPERRPEEIVVTKNSISQVFATGKTYCKGSGGITSAP